MAKFLRGMSLRPVPLVGISLGGIVALQIAADEPHLVEKLVLGNSAAWLRPEPGQLFYYLARLVLLLVLGLPAQARLVARRVFPAPHQAAFREQLIDHILMSDPAAYRRTIISLGRLDLRGRLKQVKAPTLVITGEYDTTIPPIRQAILAAGISDACHVKLPGCGHALSVECPAAFNRLLLDFLKDERG